MKKFLKEYFYLILIVLLGFFLRIYAINWQLPYLYQTEEYKTVNYVLKMAAQKSLNPKFFEYPSLYLYLMLLVFSMLFLFGKIFGFYTSAENFALKFFIDPTVVYVVGRTFSAIWGTFLIILTYVLGKLLYNKRVGIFSALIVSVLPIWVVYSHFIKPEMFSNLLVCIYCVSLYKYYLTQNIKFFYISCGILGLATSCKYLSLPSGVLLPLVYFSGNKKKFVNFILGLALIVLFFILGTPYSVLDYKTFFVEMKGIFLGPQEGLKRDIFYGVYKTFLDWIFMGNSTAFVGILCFLGVVYCAIKRKLQDLIVVCIFLIYSLVNITHYFPAWGFLFTAFPFYAIAGGQVADKFFDKSLITKIFFGLVIVISLIESIFVDIRFFLKDTRTVALEWIEKNIPQGEKVLIDRYPNSPPLKMTKQQIERLYKRAVELNHYKKEYFYWQLKAHPGENYGYEIYEVYHPPHEIGTIKHEVEEAQKVRELVDVSKGVKYIKQLGIKYIVLNSFSYTESTKNFYQEVAKTSKLVKEFLPKTKLHPGPTIRIYEL